MTRDDERSEQHWGFVVVLWAFFAIPLLAWWVVELLDPGWDQGRLVPTEISIPVLVFMVSSFFFRIARANRAKWSR